MINLKHSLLYEVDTIAWLNSISRPNQKVKTLSDVPDETLQELKDLGVKYLWLLGIYEESKIGKKIAFETKELHQKYSECLPDWTERDIKSSPYAIKSYKINEQLGGAEGLKSFRKKLIEKYGIGIILDFVPNHVALDNNLVKEHPDFFIRPNENFFNLDPDNFYKLVNHNKEEYFAHGKDPFFPAWKDTLQLDYRNPNVHKYMEEQLMNIAEISDGVRCDMSMLILNDVFDWNWKNTPLPKEVIPRGKEFWAEAIRKVKKVHPEYIFIAEVYWGKEKELLDMGFDFVYDKHLYDCILHHKCYEMKNYINAIYSFERSRLVFLENHDEPRAAAVIPFNCHMAAATIVYTLPTMKLLYHGQIEGRTKPHAIQLRRMCDETINTEIYSFYKKLFYAINSSCIKDGYFKALNSIPAWEGSPSFKNFIIYLYENEKMEKDLIVVNTSEYQSQCRVKIDSYDMINKSFYLEDRLSDKRYLRNGNEMYYEGLYLDLAPLEAQIFKFIRA